MIWAIVSSQSCFCWLYRASPSLAAKNIINLISVLTIWWCPRVESCVVGRGCLLWPMCSLGKTLNITGKKQFEWEYYQCAPLLSKLLENELHPTKTCLGKFHKKTSSVHVIYAIVEVKLKQDWSQMLSFLPKKKECNQILGESSLVA